MTGLGSVIAFRALANNDIDAYVDYSGTLWANVLGRTDHPSRATLLAELTEGLRERFGVTVLGPLGFENAYALAMRRDRARAWESAASPISLASRRILRSAATSSSSRAPSGRPCTIAMACAFANSVSSNPLSCIRRWRQMRCRSSRRSRATGGLRLTIY